MPRLPMMLPLAVFAALAAGVAAAQGSSAAPSAAPATPGPSLRRIFVVPVHDDIDQGILYIIRRGIKEAMDAGADAVILDMNTYGGSVFITEEIFTILAKFPHQDRLYTYINPRAGSAGSFIAAATHEIYMAPSAVVGAAAPVQATGEDLSETMKEKTQSFVRGIVRANAERQGHRPEVFDAMVDKDLGLTIDGVEITPKGKLLTLTSQEAEKCYGKPPRPLLSKGTVDNINTLLNRIGAAGAEVTTIEPTGLETVARFLVSIAPFLLAGAFLCGYIEFKTPGFGLFGGLAVLFAILFFFGHSIAGLSGYENIIVFVLGVLLILVELFLFPGFIMPGLLGVLLVFVSLVRAMVDTYPTEPVVPALPQLAVPLANLGIATLLTALGVVLLAWILPKTPLYHALVLGPGAGCTAPLQDHPHISPGDRGVSETLLRPSGRALIHNEPVDVVTEGDYIPAGRPIVVLRVEASRVIVSAA